MIKTKSKLPDQGTTIFTTISSLAREHKAINLGQGFPNFPVSSELIELANQYSKSGKNQYAPMPGLFELRSVIADKANKLYGSNINPDKEITITAGATQALFTAITAFVNTGDEVVIIEPAYDSYAPSIEIMGGKVIAYQLDAPDFKIDWDRFATLITSKTRMILINTPQNPIGKVLQEKDLLAIQELTADTDIILMSDEVYEHLIYDNQSHQSALRFPDLWDRLIAVYSFGKTFHATGWKIGYAIAPAHLMKEFRAIHQWNVFSVNSFLQYALAEYLQNENNYLSLPSFYQAKRDLFQDAMKESRFKALKSEGSYFQLYDYSEISDQSDLEFAKELIVKNGVASIPISPFYSTPTDHKLVRFCFAKGNETLLTAAAKLCEL